MANPNALIAFTSTNGSNEVLVTSSSNNGLTYSGMYANTNQESLHKPAMVIFKGRVFIAYQDTDGSSALRVVSSPDGITWATPYSSPGAGMTGGPAMVVFQNKLWVCLKPILILMHCMSCLPSME
jgi:hypothetical protein